MIDRRKAMLARIKTRTGAWVKALPAAVANAAALREGGRV
jgi:hypothetical protein